MLRQATTLESLQMTLGNAEQQARRREEEIMRKAAIRAAERALGKREAEFSMHDRSLLSAYMAKMRPEAPVREIGRPTFQFADVDEREPDIA